MGSADADLLADLPTEALRAKALGMLTRSLNRAAVTGPPQGLPTPLDQPSSAREGAVVSYATAHEMPPGHSTEQQDAEAAMLALLSEAEGVVLAPRRLHLKDGSYADVDGVSDSPPILVEAWAHQGPPIGGQRNKVLADALKLAHVASELGRGHRKVLCMADEEAARRFCGGSWFAGALRRLGVEVVVVRLDAATRAGIRAAQARQRR